MATPTRSLSQIINDAITYLGQVQSNLTTLIGSVTRDVVIASPAQEFAKVYTELTRVSQIQSLTNPTVMTVEELDSLGANYLVPRNQGVASQSTVTFRVSGLSSLEPNINISAGTVVTTQQTARASLVSFSTTQAGTFISASAANYFNPLTGFYELTLPVQAQAVGSIGNVNAGAINVLSTTIPRIFSVTNTIAATGGTDQESNTAYAARIQLKLSGNNLGTVNGIKSLVLANNNALDVSVVGPNDVEMLRNEFGGSVDIYVLGSLLTSTADTKTFLTSGPRTFVLLHQPAIVTTGSVVVSGTAGGVPKLFVENVDYQLITDPTTLVNDSTEIQNAVKFLDSGTLPDDNTQVVLAYTYNQLIETLQDTFNSEANHIVGADILVKEAHLADIQVSASISVIPGFNSADTLSLAQTAVTTLINTNKLGTSFNQSDVVGAIESTLGVDEVDLTSLVIKKNTVVVTTQKISIDKTEYASASIINLTPIV